MKLNWANRITITRIFLIIPFVFCMLRINNTVLGNPMRYLSITIYSIILIGDVLDGYLARSNNQKTKLGAFLDPLADKLLTTCACLLLSSSQWHIRNFALPRIVAVFLIGKDVILLAGFLAVSLINFQFYIAPVWAGRIAGRLQLFLVLAIMISPEISRLIPDWIWFLRVSWWSAALLSVNAICVYIYNAVRSINHNT